MSEAYKCIGWVRLNLMGEGETAPSTIVVPVNRIVGFCEAPDFEGLTTLVFVDIASFDGDEVERVELSQSLDDALREVDDATYGGTS